MPYTSPATGHNPTTGNAIPASWGDDVNTALDFLATNFPHCSIKESTAQAITTSTYTALTSDEENSDVGGMHSTVSNTDRVTVPASEGGLYEMTATVSFDANATGERFIGFGKNGSSPTFSAMGIAAAPTSATSLTGATSMVLVAGDYVTCHVFHTRGSNLNCTMNDFSVRWRATA